MKSQVLVRHRRRILCVFPRYAPSFGTFHHAYPLMDGVRAFMAERLASRSPLPRGWEFVWSTRTRGRSAIRSWLMTRSLSAGCVEARSTLARRARPRHATVLGGSSVSASPEQYPEFDYLHLGEIGDATDALICAIDEDVSPPSVQRRFVTRERLPLADFPIPAYELIDGRRYFIGSIQFSSGCPYRCEFCDIPALYGRQPRLKTAEQIVAELDARLPPASRPRSISWTTISSATRGRRASCSPHLVAGRNGTAIRCSCAAKRPSISPRAPRSWR